MAEYKFARGDRYALTCPLTKDNVAFDATAGSWVVTATLGQGDVVKATTETEVPGVLGVGKTTLTVQNTTTGCAVTICNSILLSEGLYDLEVHATDGTAAYTWPTWSIHIVEPQRV
jgi:hypothetical protein